jgi:DNA polymerase-4
MASVSVNILHVDMDAFYASIEQRDRPELRGRPVIVGGSAAHRGVVCAASYEARKFGVHSAMPAATARRLCPEGVFLPVRMAHYAQIARELRQIFQSFTPLVEPMSLDEAYLDVKGCEGLFGPPVVLARKLKECVRVRTGLTASVGVAGNKFLAKLASDLSKPNGLLVLEPDRVKGILDPLPVSRIWGVGAKGEKQLQSLGICTIGQLTALPEKVLQNHFGDAGSSLWRLAHGLDDRPVVPDEAAKSVSTETTFARDIGDRAVLRSWLLGLVEQLGQRVRHLGVRAWTIDLKIRTSEFRTYTRAQTLAEPTDLTEAFWQAARGIFERRVPDDWLPLRLLGVGASSLFREMPMQLGLFDQEWQAKQRALDQATDLIRQQFGAGAVRRGGLLDSKQEP